MKKKIRGKIIRSLRITNLSIPMHTPLLIIPRTIILRWLCTRCVCVCVQDPHLHRPRTHIRIILTDIRDEHSFLFIFLLILTLKSVITFRILNGPFYIYIPVDGKTKLKLLKPRCVSFYALIKNRFFCWFIYVKKKKIIMYANHRIMQ